MKKVSMFLLLSFALIVSTNAGDVFTQNGGLGGVHPPEVGKEK
ncbi:hypothetical protein [Priestia taiwanensis]|uniref:Phr family secreted Rap phosphatase inhibitor n=1 Tax=Priestia taiwanensis TaxID=1347902 RepID=A0A917ARU7_9BACI|nr:hypothetical protein [Priestia taiwanensis]MBM7363931.1 hypothetical protein [Priestia taiwanensis]GGE70241.1 hypothetical protein GCM10007140_20220 [Priestia taiwanensis]